METAIYYDIIIIGGGAAGLMAGYAAGHLSSTDGKQLSIAILEKMPRPARKIVITGKGRCNYTNMREWDDFSRRVRSGVRLLRPAFFNLPPAKLVELFGQFGLESVTERGQRVFPYSHRSLDVVDTLREMAAKAGAQIITSCEVISVSRLNDASFSIQSSDGKSYRCSRLIIATGGLSYPATGSSGDGYSFAKSLGHSIINCHPSLTALIPDNYRKLSPIAAGIHLRNVQMTLFVGQDAVESEFGEIDFTSAGIEGPVGIQLSRSGVNALINGQKASLVLDLKSCVSLDELENRIKKLWQEIENDARSTGLPAKSRYKVLLGKLMPRELIPLFNLCNPNILNHNSLDVHSLCKSLKEWQFNINSYVGYERAVVTAGGVDCSQVLAKTLESRLCQGLYFAGEVLDIDADTGGYNLQIAFSTGYLAGLSAAKSIESATTQQ